MQTITRETIKVLINGEFTQANSKETLDVTNPANQEILAQVPLCNQIDLENAVKAAKEAYPIWKEMGVAKRARIFLKLQALLKENDNSNSFS